MGLSALTRAKTDDNGGFWKPLPYVLAARRTVGQLAAKISTIFGQINAGGCVLKTDLPATPGQDWNDVLKACGAQIKPMTEFFRRGLWLPADFKPPRALLFMKMTGHRFKRGALL
jgi:hypothetical protein